ncbi:MAG: flagellin lysine-N-methylase [Acutalibacteraceae bacterium]
MKYILPDFYEDFKCLADLCPKTCCSGFLVEIDRDTQKKYSCLDGPLGEKIREKMFFDGESYFLGKEKERCPFLLKNSLCEIICDKGEDYLSFTCRNFPRVSETYGMTQETVMSLSCPWVANLFTKRKTPICMILKEDNREIDEISEIPPDIYLRAKKVRKEMLGIFKDRNYPFSVRLDKVKNKYSFYSRNERDIFRIFKNAEFIENDFYHILESTEKFYFDSSYAFQVKNKDREKYDHILENVSIYLCYRHILTSVFDKDIKSKINMVISSLELLQMIFAYIEAKEEKDDFSLGYADALICFSREIEHSAENVALIGKCL